MADGYSGQEHSFPIAPLYKDVTMFVAKTKTFYTPTILVAYGAPVFAFGKPWFGLLEDGSACRWWTASGLVAGATRRRCPAGRCWCSVARTGRGNC